MSAKKEIQDFITKQNNLDTLRYITCGSVDDGKSTLLGRMLYEAQLIFDDQVDSLVKDSKKVGTQGGDIDFALLVDGLSAEREQGITIDVAYRFFSTENRKFIVADSPGHEQYTRNMVTAASNAELAIILIDARNGIMPQTRRHTFLANLLGIKNIIVAVNKMDLVDYDKEIFNKIVTEYNNDVLSKLDISNSYFIPLSALKGDNIVTNSKNMEWYKNMPLMKYLEEVKIDAVSDSNFTMPVQLVNRPNLNFRGFCGTVASGEISVGSDIEVTKSGECATIKEIFLGEKKVEKCSKSDAAMITLNKEIDISRGDILTERGNTIKSIKSCLANVVWFDTEECFKSRKYLIKSANRYTNCQILKIKHKVNVNNYEKVQCGSLAMNDIAECEISFDDEYFAIEYQKNKVLGSFIIVDKLTNLTVGAGTFKHPLRKAENIKWQHTDIGRSNREKILGQKALVLWFTGLSGSGKSTISNLLEKKLYEENKLSYILDGDNLRHGLNSDLGFNEEDRVENLRRVGEVAKLIHDSGLIVLASFISPFRKDRQNIRSKFPENNFIEIYIKTSLEELKTRDPKGLYKRAISGQIPNFTGISSPYEEPKNPEIIIDTEKFTATEAVEIIYKFLKERKCL